MTDAQHARWEAYFRTLADSYGLKDWEIIVERDRPGDGAGADCTVWYAQRRATVRLAEDPFDKTDDRARHDQRRMALHELTHCHVEYADEAVRLAFKDSDAPRDALFRDYYRRASELVVDGIASAIAPLFPLPGGPA